MWTAKREGGFQIVHVSPQGGRGGQGDGPCGLFSALKSLFSKNDLEKKIICITIFKKIKEKKVLKIRPHGL